MSCAVPAFSACIGCQSNAQYDQAARELRMQEDELYAMEDYLEEYQRLVCKYRSENATLRRRLAENGATIDTEPRTNGRRPTPATPDLDVVPPADSTMPPVEIESPDVPPLGETTSTEGSGRIQSGEDGTVRPASHDEAVSPAAQVADVWLRGEVVPNDAGGGPRMVVEIQPLDAENSGMDFNGALSLMLTAPDGEGGKVSVARWNYRADEVQTAVDTLSGQNTIRFHLELPADSSASEATELWARLLPRHGGKVISHAAIDLHQPSTFSSRDDVMAASALADSQSDSTTSGGEIITASYEDDSHDPESLDVVEQLTADMTPVSAEIYDGGWTIAKPGQPAGIPQQSDVVRSDWRASMEPPPTALSHSVETRQRPPVRRRQLSRTHARERAASAEAWSPDRSARQTERVADVEAARPAWSATR